MCLVILSFLASGVSIGDTQTHMDSTKILCPKCQTEISLNEALSGKLGEAYEKKLEEEKRKLWKIAQEKAEEKITAKLGQEAEELKEELEEKSKLLDEARKFEADLRKKTRELEEKEKNLELEKQRQIDEERKKIREKTEFEMSEKYHLKEKEKDSIIESLKKSLEDAQRKATQGSQQLQGEVLELELEEVLRREFPIDGIEEVSKGKFGADVIQIVKDNLGRECGKIIWESKRTRNFEEGWIEKLKGDMREAKADSAILVSTVLPKDVRVFGQKKGVYITSFECLVEVASVLRESLITLANMKALTVGKNERIESLYKYITSSEFAQKIESMMETYLQMQQELETEKNAIQKIWAKREMRIEKLKNNTIQIHGSLSGLIDVPMPQVKSLEFSEIDILLDD